MNRPRLRVARALRLAGRRHNHVTNQNIAIQNPETNENISPFRKISSEMDRRRTSYNLELHTSTTFAHPKKPIVPSISVTFHEFTSAYQVGDLIVSRKNGLAVILESPDSEQRLSILSSSGAVAKVKRTDLVFRLGKFCDSEILKGCVREIHVDGAKEPIALVADGVRESVLRPLRAMMRMSYFKTEHVRKHVDELIDGLSVSGAPVNISFYEFSSRILSAVNGYHNLDISFPPSITESMDAILLVAIYDLLQLAYSSQVILQSNTLTLMPSGDPIARVALHDYNFDDFTLRSTAAAQLKKKFSENVTEELAMRVAHASLSTPQGPMLSKSSLQFLSNGKYTESSPLIQISEKPLFDTARDRKNNDDVEVFCIDAADAAEIDDGISVTNKGDTLEFGVHIADPTSALHGKVSLLEQPYKLTSAAYYPTDLVPMMPRAFTDRFGLTPGSRRRCLSVYFKDSPTGPKLDRIVRENVRNIVKMTYDSVDEILEKKSESPHEAALRQMARLANVSRDKRIANGALTMSIPYSDVAVRNGNIKISKFSLSVSRKLVEEFMIMANSLIAQFTSESYIPSLYRAQQAHFHTPTAPKPFKSEAARINAAFEMIRRMNGASLTTTSHHHDALSLRYYTHATSPLRRFQDMMVHWQLHSHLNSQRGFTSRNLGAMAVHIQSTQQLIGQAQRHAQNYWKLKRIAYDYAKYPASQYACVVISEPNFVGLTQVFCTTYGLEAFVKDLPKHDKLGPGSSILCSMDHVDPDSLTLMFKFDTMHRS